MIPALWFVVKVNKLRIPIPLFLFFPLALALELIAFVPLLVFAIIKKRFLFVRLAFGFYLSRLMLALILYGRRFQVKVCDNNSRIRIAGKWLTKYQYKTNLKTQS